MIGTKIESNLQFGKETLQLSGRVSAIQRSNYQLLSVAHAFRKYKARSKQFCSNRKQKTFARLQAMAALF